MKPLHSSLAEVGANEMLERGIRLLAKYENVVNLPSWVYTLDFESGLNECVIEECGDVVTKLRNAEQSLREGTSCHEVHKCANTPTPPGAAVEECAMRRLLFASTRVAFGAAVEAANAKEAFIIAPPGARKTDVFAIARLYNDAFLAAIWPIIILPGTTTKLAGLVQRPQCCTG